MYIYIYIYIYIYVYVYICVKMGNNVKKQTGSITPLGRWPGECEGILLSVIK